MKSTDKAQDLHVLSILQSYVPSAFKMAYIRIENAVHEYHRTRVQSAPILFTRQGDFYTVGTPGETRTFRANNAKGMGWLHSIAEAKGHPVPYGDETQWRPVKDALHRAKHELRVECPDLAEILWSCRAVKSGAYYEPQTNHRKIFTST